MSLGYSLLHSMVDFVGSWTSNEQVLCPWPVLFLYKYNIYIIKFMDLKSFTCKPSGTAGVEWKITRLIIICQNSKEDFY